MNASPSATLGVATPNTTGGRLESLQALRGLAALAVLTAHFKFTAQTYDFQRMPAWAASGLGGVGVDLFFVISGFVISMTADRKQQSAREFLTARAIRVLPLYWLLSLPYLLKELLSADRNGRVILNSLFFLPLADVGKFTHPAHPYGWTLSFEIWFYTLFALLLLWFAPRRAGGFLPLMLGTACGFAASISLRPEGWYFPWFALHPLCLEFCAGCVLYRYHERFGRVEAGVAGTLAALLLAVVLPRMPWLGEAFEFMDRPDWSWQRALVWGGSAVCLVIAALGWERSSSRVLPRWMLVVGDASFSLYLIQPYTLFAIRRLGIDNLLISSGCFLVLTLLASVAFWRWVELPLTRVARRWFGGTSHQIRILKAGA